MVKRVAFVRRRPGMTVEQFWAHYTGPHASIVRTMPGLRRMLLSRPVGSQPGDWDAVGELWFDSTDALEQAFADPTIATLLAADRPLFLGRAEVVIVEEVLCWPAAGA